MTKGYEQRKEANKRYLEKFEEIRVRVPKGMKDIIKNAAQMQGKSLNQYMLDCAIRVPYGYMISENGTLVPNPKESGIIKKYVGNLTDKPITSTHEPIISEEQFQKVQEKLQENKEGQP